VIGSPRACALRIASAVGTGLWVSATLCPLTSTVVRCAGGAPSAGGASAVGAAVPYLAISAGWRHSCSPALGVGQDNIAVRFMARDCAGHDAAAEIHPDHGAYRRRRRCRARRPRAAVSGVGGVAP